MNKSEERFIMIGFYILWVAMIFIFLISTAHAYSEPITINQSCISIDNGTLTTIISNSLNYDSYILNNTGCSPYSVVTTKNYNYSPIYLSNSTTYFNTTNTYTTFITVNNGSNSTLQIQQQNLSCGSSFNDSIFQEQNRIIEKTIQDNLQGQTQAQQLYTACEQSRQTIQDQLKDFKFNQSLAEERLIRVESEIIFYKAERDSYFKMVLVLILMVMVMIFYSFGGDYSRFWKRKPRIGVIEGGRP